MTVPRLQAVVCGHTLGICSQAIVSDDMLLSFLNFESAEPGIIPDQVHVSLDFYSGQISVFNEGGDVVQTWPILETVQKFPVAS